MIILFHLHVSLKQSRLTACYWLEYFFMPSVNFLAYAYLFPVSRCYRLQNLVINYYITVFVNSYDFLYKKFIYQNCHHSLEQLDLFIYYEASSQGRFSYVFYGPSSLKSHFIRCRLSTIWLKTGESIDQSYRFCLTRLWEIIYMYSYAHIAQYI